CGAGRPGRQGRCRYGFGQVSLTDDVVLKPLSIQRIGGGSRLPPLTSGNATVARSGTSAQHLRLPRGARSVRCRAALKKVLRLGPRAFEPSPIPETLHMPSAPYRSARGRRAHPRSTTLDPPRTPPP